MPWHVNRSAQCPVSKPFGVIKDADGSVVGCHATEESARDQVAALYAKEGTMNPRSALDAYDNPPPASGVQYRAFAPQLEVRSGNGGRTIFGIAVPWDTPTRVNGDLIETFARTAFDDQINDVSHHHQVKLENEHVELGGVLIGAATLLRNDPAGLYFEGQVANTPKGDETLELIKTRALDRLSVAFRAKRDRRLGRGMVERVRAHLKAVAITRDPAYTDAAIAGVRSAFQFGEEPVDLELRMAAEPYLGGLRPLPDTDLEIRRIKLGIPR